jgi:hypothetical protein
VHPKLLLLFFEDRLRIVVCSANLHPAEWETVGQVIWTQDFKPLKESGHRLGSGAREASIGARALLQSFHSQFLSTLFPFIAFLQHSADDSGEEGCKIYRMWPGQQWLSWLAAYDFSPCKVTLVASVPGFSYDHYSFEAIPEPPFLAPKPTTSTISTIGSSIIASTTTLTITNTANTSTITTATTATTTTAFTNTKFSSGILGYLSVIFYPPPDGSPREGEVIAVLQQLWGESATGHTYTNTHAHTYM